MYIGHNQWVSDHIFIGIQSWNGLLKEGDMYPLMTALEQHCNDSVHGLHPLHFRILKLREDKNTDGTAKHDDEYENYCQYLKQKQDEMTECNQIQSSSGEERERYKNIQYNQERNSFIKSLDTVERLQKMKEIDIEWKQRPKFWDIIERRFSEMNRSSMLESFPLCFLLKAPISNSPWFIPVHQC